MGEAARSEPTRGARALQAAAATTLAVAVLGVPASPAYAQAGVALFTWGSNSYGELGNGITQGGNFDLPTAAVQPEGVLFQHVSAGDGLSAGLSDGGTVYTWGVGDAGGHRDTPGAVPVPGVTFQTVAAGTAFMIALADDNTVYTWGDNSQAQLGNGNRGGAQPDPAPINMPGGATITAIAAGNNFALARGNDGTVYSWGSNSLGQLGCGCADLHLTSPEPIDMPTGVTFSSIAAGHDFALALADDTDGTLYSWGANHFGQLGNSSADNNIHNSPQPGTMPGGVTFTDIAAGGAFGLALRDDNTAYSWGYNGDGQLGDNNGGAGDAHSPTPGPVTMPDGVTFTTIDAGTAFGMGMTSDGVAYIWGDNSAGELGIGPAEDQLTPVPVHRPGIERFEALALGATHVVSLAIPLPRQITPSSGDEQTVQVHEPFPDRLVASVTATDGTPVPHLKITFTINSPATFPDGASTADATTGFHGTATSPPLTATGDPGAVTVEATTGGVPGSATYHLTVLAEPNPTPTPTAPSPPSPPPTPNPSPTHWGTHSGHVGTHSGGLPATGTPGIRLLAAGATLTIVGLLAIAATRPTRRRQ